MKLSSATIKKNVSALKDRALSLYNAQVKARALRITDFVKTEIIAYPDFRERRRRLIILFALIFLLDYLMYCLHTDKNIADIFPSIPSLDQEKQVSVYLPGLDGTTITRELRYIPVYDSEEKTAQTLFEIVADGASYDNTAMAVPVDLFVRKVWIYGRGKGKSKICVIDLEPAELRPELIPIKNSERLFKKALEKTIRENIPSVKTVMLLEKGVPGVSIWEL